MSALKRIPDDALRQAVSSTLTLPLLDRTHLTKYGLKAGQESCDAMKLEQVMVMGTHRLKSAELPKLWIYASKGVSQVTLASKQSGRARHGGGCSRFVSLRGFQENREGVSMALPPGMISHGWHHAF